MVKNGQVMLMVEIAATRSQDGKKRERKKERFNVRFKGHGSIPKLELSI
jgi:hypothetical protein